MYLSYSREERKLQIAKVLAVRAIESKPPATMREIASAIGIKANGRLMGMLWEMTDEQKLTSKCYHYRPGWVVYKWSLSASHYNVVLDKIYGEQTA